MSKRRSLEASQTFSIAKEQIINRDYHFYMRNKEQDEYHPKNVHFIDKRYRRAYIIQDMAGLVTSNEISNFLSDFAYKLRMEQYDKMSKEEIGLIGKFINEAKEEYDNCSYIDLEQINVQK